MIYIVYYFIVCILCRIQVRPDIRSRLEQLTITILTTKTGMVAVAIMDSSPVAHVMFILGSVSEQQVLIQAMPMVVGPQCKPVVTLPQITITFLQVESYIVELMFIIQ